MERRRDRNSDAVTGGISTLPESGVALRTEPFAEGELIGGKYVVERVIGLGGVAVVVAARHLELQEIVAIKILQPQFVVRREVVQRFSREARAAARIKSEYAARIFDVGVEPGRGPYLVMEYLEGQDLGEVLDQRGPLPVRRAVEFIMQACEALAVAHTNGIIHRDIKPENLFLARRPDGGEAIKVLDFGISKTSLTGSMFGGDESPLKTQELMGTPLYMSPEQIRSTANVDHRADIWSLGVVLYELLSGHLPFHAEVITKICAHVLEADPVPLSRHVADLPEGLQAVIERCLQKDPERRFQNVAELAIALLPFGPKMARVFAERTSTTLLAAGQTNVTLRFSSSHPPPPPSGPPDPHLNIPTLSGVQPVTTEALLASGEGLLPRPSRVPSGGLVPDPMATTASGRPLDLPLSSPEALEAIAVEGRRTRRTIAVASGLALVIVSTLAIYAFVREHKVPAAATAATAAVTERPVTIESEPPGVRVEWHGKLLGETPLTASLPLGAQSVALSKDGFSPETLSVSLTADDTERRTLHVSLTRVPAPQPATPPAPPPSATSPRSVFVAPPPPAPSVAWTHPARTNPKPPASVPSQPTVTVMASPPPSVTTTSAPPVPSVSGPAPVTPLPKIRVVDDSKRVRVLDDSTVSKVPVLR